MRVYNVLLRYTHVRGKQMIRKKKIFIASSIIAFGMIASTTAAVLLSKNGNPLSRLEADEYTVVFNNANGGSSFSSSYVNSDQTNNSAKTTSGYTLAVDYKNGKKSNNNYIDLQGTSGGAGYIYNTTDITGIKSITVKFSGSLSLYVSDSTSFPETGESINNNQEYTYEGGDTHFKLLNSGSDSAIIEQITVKYSCTPLARYYEKVTSGTVENGQYLIVYEAGSKAFNGGLTTLDAVSNTIPVTINSNKIEKTATTAAAEFTISGTSIQSKSGYYIGRTSDSNGMNTSESDDYTNQITVSDGEADIVSSNAYLRYNANASDNRFRYYRSSSYTNQQPIALYKLGGSGGGGDDPTPTPTTETYEVTINMSNTGLPTSAGTSTVAQSWILSDEKTTISATWGAGAYNLTEYTEFRMNRDSYLKSNCNVVVKSMYIDFYSKNPLTYVTVTAGGNAVTGTSSSKTGKGNAYDFNINSSDWEINASNGFVVFYSITIYCEIETGPVAVTGVSLNTNSLELYESASQTLVATVSPSNATNKNVTWTSSNESVATVDSSGKVSALSAGTTTITVTTEDGSKTASCLVTVKASVKVTGVTLNKSSTTLTRTHTETLTATVLPENASNKAVTWSSNNETVASVSSTGVITANAVGTAAITVTTQDGNKTATCNVTVNPIPVSSVTLDKESLDLKVTQSSELTATITPDNADSQTVTWSVDKNIVTLSSTTGKTITVTGATASEESAIITATCGGQSATCTVTVSESSTPVAGSEFELVSSTSDLNSGDYVILGCYAKQAVAGAFNISKYYLESVSATIANDKVTLAEGMEVFEVEISGSNYNFKAIALDEYYLGYSGQNLTQSKSDFSVSISSGTLTMSGESIPMRYNNSSPRFRLYTSSTNMSEVQFYKLSGKVTGVSLNASDIGLNNGNTYQLTATVSPAGALNKNVTWASSNESVATVNAEGLVTANSTAASGSTATITVTTADGGKTATCKITVMSGSTIVPTSITLNKTSGSIAVGETVSLQANLKPENVTDKSVTWTSNKTSVATVSSSGVVTGAGEGSATITAKTVNNLTATFTVTVTTVHIDEWTIMIYMCGSDLESGNGFATSDITEILDTVNQGKADYNEDVNIIFETGGSSAWKKYNISTTKLERYHVQNGTSIVREDSLTYSAMGKQSTFESFLQWGLNSYPAKKTGVILWNHGGGMQGVCHDEKSSEDDSVLLNNEVRSAFANKIGSNKLEFVGYDACLMQVQDIAETNSDYFNYMVAAQESEAGEGWAYSDWVDNLYNGDDTETILSEITRSFVESYEQKYGKTYDNDQTLSALDLTKMSDYKTAIENIAADVGNAINSYNGSSGKTKFQLYAKHNIKGFGTSIYDSAGDLEYYEGVSTNPSAYNYYENYGIEYDESTGLYTAFGSDYFGSFDAYDFLTTVSSLKTLSSTKLKAVKDAIDKLVISNVIGDEAGNCCGICVFFNTHSYADKSTCYANDQTRFTNWRSMVNTYAA